MTILSGKIVRYKSYAADRTTKNRMLQLKILLETRYRGEPYQIGAIYCVRLKQS